MSYTDPLEKAKTLGLSWGSRCQCHKLPPAVVRHQPCPHCRSLKSRGKISKGRGAKSTTDKRRRAPPRALEHAEQVQIVAAMRRARLLFAGSLNGVHTGRAQSGKAKAAGMEAGEPDLRIYGHPTRPDDVSLDLAAKVLDVLIEHGPKSPELAELMEGGAVDLLRRAERWLELGAPAGLMIELKAPNVAKRNRHTDRFAGTKPHQRERMHQLEAAGFPCVVAYNRDDAIQKMRDEGYNVGGKR